MLDLGHFNNLSAARKDSLMAAINWLLKQQDLTGNATTNSNYGSWHIGLQNYDTALAIKPTDRILIFNTGASQKYPEAVNEQLPRIDIAKPIDWEKLER